MAFSIGDRVLISWTDCGPKFCLATGTVSSRSLLSGFDFLKVRLDCGPEPECWFSEGAACHYNGMRIRSEHIGYLVMSEPAEDDVSCQP